MSVEKWQRQPLAVGSDGREQVLPWLAVRVCVDTTVGALQAEEGTAYEQRVNELIGDLDGGEVVVDEGAVHIPSNRPATGRKDSGGVEEEEEGSAAGEREGSWQWSNEIELTDDKIGRRQRVVLQSERGELLVIACELSLLPSGVRCATGWQCIWRCRS